MTLIIPTLEDYKHSTDKVVEFLDGVSEKIDWIVYGSFSTGKVRPGLSDIDMMMLAHTDDILFPVDILLAFAPIKSSIEKLRIPLQVNTSTTGGLQSSIFASDYAYLKEVEQGIKRGKSSSDVSGLFVEHRDKNLDDMNMVRYFLRKINTLPENINKVQKILFTSSMSDITSDNQKDLWYLWDTFKKMMSLVNVIVRIKSNDSLFAERDAVVLDNFKQTFNLEMDLSKYVQVLKSIKNIEDWYNYLKDEGAFEIIEIYKDIFVPMINAIDNQFTIK